MRLLIVVYRREKSSKIETTNFCKVFFYWYFLSFYYFFVKFEFFPLFFFKKRQTSWNSCLSTSDNYLFPIKGTQTKTTGHNITIWYNSTFTRGTCILEIVEIHGFQCDGDMKFIRHEKMQLREALRRRKHKTELEKPRCRY